LRSLRALEPDGPLPRRRGRRSAGERSRRDDHGSQISKRGRLPLGHVPWTFADLGPLHNPAVEPSAPSAHLATAETPLRECTGVIQCAVRVGSLTAAANRRVHGNRLRRTRPPVFEDEKALSVQDEIRAVSGAALLTLDRSLARVVVVAYTSRGRRIRIRLARRATPAERRQYRGGGR